MDEYNVHIILGGPGISETYLRFAEQKPNVTMTSQDIKSVAYGPFVCRLEYKGKDPSEVAKLSTSVHTIECTISRRILHEYTFLQIGILISLLVLISL